MKMALALSTACLLLSGCAGSIVLIPPERQVVVNQTLPSIRQNITAEKITERPFGPGFSSGFK